MIDRTPNAPRHDLSQQAERDGQARAARLARIKQDLLDRPREIKRRMASQPRVRLQIAENLWNIVESAHSRSPEVTRAAVLHAAGMGRKEESTKRAEYYFCDPTLPDEKRVKRAKKLTQDPEGYARLARKTAKLLGLEDQDAFLLDLFSGTPFAAEIESDLPAEDPRREAWSMLQSLLRHQAQKIAEECNLRRYYPRQTGWRLRYEDGEFKQGGAEFKEPSVFLGWVDAGYPRRGVFRFRSLDPREAYGSECTPEDEANFADLISRNAYELAVNVETVLVLHLVLAPQGAGGEVVPCLRARCISYIAAAEHWDALKPLNGAQLQRGDLIAVCHRAIATKTELPPKRLPESLTAGLVKAQHRQNAPEREFEIGENEMVCRPMAFDEYGFDMGDVVLPDHLSNLPPSLASADPFDEPRIILPAGEEALAILSLPISTCMADRSWAEANSSQPWSARPKLLTELTQALVDDWLGADEDGRAIIDAIAAKKTPFPEGSMIAALDRACQSARHEKTPINQLRRIARELSAALDAAIASLEAQRDANLRESRDARD